MLILKQLNNAKLYRIEYHPLWNKGITEQSGLYPSRPSAVHQRETGRQRNRETTCTPAFILPSGTPVALPPLSLHLPWGPAPSTELRTRAALQKPKPIDHAVAQPPTLMAKAGQKARTSTPTPRLMKHPPYFPVGRC